MDFEDIYYTCKNLPKDIKLGKYSAKNYRTEGVSDIAHAVKSDNPDILKKWIAINRIARHIIDQNILTKKDYIVPAPQHTGRADYTLKIAKIISEETGCKIADVLGCKPRDTLYNLKKKNGAKSIEDSGLYLLTDKFPKYNVWFLDNVTATGKTFDDARKLIPHLKPLIYSISPRLKVKMKNRKPYFMREEMTHEENANSAARAHHVYGYDYTPLWVKQGRHAKSRSLYDYDSEEEVKAFQKEMKAMMRKDRQEKWKKIKDYFFGPTSDTLGCGYTESLKEGRTYFGDEIKEVVDWLIESPYNNWQEKDREYLMSCDNEKLFKYESDTFDLECAERSLYESKKITQKRIEESFEKVLNENKDIKINRLKEYIPEEEVEDFETAISEWNEWFLDNYPIYKDDSNHDELILRLHLLLNGFPVDFNMTGGEEQYLNKNKKWGGGGTWSKAHSLIEKWYHIPEANKMWSKIVDKVHKERMKESTEESFERVLNEARTIRNGQAIKSVESLFDFALAKTYFEGLINDLNGKIIRNEDHRMVAYIDAPRTTSVILDLGSNYSSHNFELQVIIGGKVQDAWEGNSDKEFITALDELFETYENGEPRY